MIQTCLIQNAHSDLVTDACYDMYGLQLATCGLDQRIKIWTLDDTSETWVVEDDWKAHEAALTTVSWAHPEFGSIIASSSFDRTVKVWEQMPIEFEQQVNGSAPVASSSQWAERAVLMDAKGSVRAVQFAPHHFGLKLAAISSDNHLRIYECLEQPALTTWQLAEEVDVLALPAAPQHASSSLAHTFTTTTPTQTSATLDGASVSLATSMSALAQQQAALAQAPSRPGMGSREADGGWCVSWCKDRYWGEVIAVGCGVGGTIKIIQFSPSHRPLTLLTLETTPANTSTTAHNTSNTTAPGSRTATSASAQPPTSVTQASADADTPYAITSVAWAPSCGRSFHLIATGSRDGKVRIWKVRPPVPAEEQEQDPAADGADEKWTAGLVAEFDDHKSTVGRVEWNITGTILSSSGNDGRVRLWKQTMGNVWRPAGQISVEQAEERIQDGDVDMDESALAE